MKWSEEAWQQAEPIYDAILHLPFVEELTAGTLSRDRFEFYIAQDALYLSNYFRVLAHIAYRIPGDDNAEAFLRFALDGVEVEKALHESFIGKDAPTVAPSPACRLYMDFETSVGGGAVEVEVAAVLPCFWVYQRVGEEIYKKSRKDNPYRKWIETYSDSYFSEATRKAISICDELAARAREEIRGRMTTAFVQASRMEWMFWDSAYNKENGKFE